MHTAVRWIIMTTTLLASGLAHAYVGPGAGLSAIGSVLALIGAVLLMIVGFVWYPMKRLLKRKKPEPPPTEAQASSSSDLQSNQPTEDLQSNQPTTDES